MKKVLVVFLSLTVQVSLSAQDSLTQLHTAIEQNNMAAAKSIFRQMATDEPFTVVGLVTNNDNFKDFVYDDVIPRRLDVRYVLTKDTYQKLTAAGVITNEVIKLAAQNLSAEELFFAAPVLRCCTWYEETAKVKAINSIFEHPAVVLKYAPSLYQYTWYKAVATDAVANL
ncbi:MAG: hypothetical protein ACKKL5_00455 [Candidatus Komeilibacteria bacterium]